MEQTRSWTKVIDRSLERGNPIEFSYDAQIVKVGKNILTEALHGEAAQALVVGIGRRFNRNKHASISCEILGDPKMIMIIPLKLQMMDSFGLRQKMLSCLYGC